MNAPIRIIWTPEEGRHFLALKLQGYQVGQIADSVGRARSTVGQRITALIRQMTPREQMQYAEKRPVPPGRPPTLGAEHASEIIRGWTEEMDATAIEMRGRGCSYETIGKAVGRNQARVNDRLMKLEQMGRFKRDPAEMRVLTTKAVLGDTLKRPEGPIPANPEPPKSPRHAGYRTCLTCMANGRTKYFWSPSAAVRRCDSCKKMFSRCDDQGDGRRIDDRLELSLHL